MWQWVARGNIQQISYIPQTEQHLPFGLMLHRLGNVTNVCVCVCVCVLLYILYSLEVPVCVRTIKWEIFTSIRFRGLPTNTPGKNCASFNFATKSQSLTTLYNFTLARKLTNIETIIIKVSSVAEELPCQREQANSKDPFTVAVKIDLIVSREKFPRSLLNAPMTKWVNLLLSYCQSLVYRLQLDH